MLAAGVLQAFAGITVEEFEAQADTFLRSARHPTLDRGYLACAYTPMVELLGYLEANGFANYIASGGGRDFLRPISQELYGVPRQRVIGSSTALAWEPGEGGGRIVRKPELDVLDDGPAKPVRIWSRVGRRPLLAAGNSNGDLPMLQFAAQPGRPGLRLLVVHDDPEREFDYTTGAEQAPTAGPSSASSATGRRSSRPTGRWFGSSGPARGRRRAWPGRSPASGWSTIR